jgi:hypothetical protein
MERIFASASLVMVAPSPGRAAGATTNDPYSNLYCTPILSFSILSIKD